MVQDKAPPGCPFIFFLYDTRAGEDEQKIESVRAGPPVAPDPQFALFSPSAASTFEERLPRQIKDTTIQSMNPGLLLAPTYGYGEIPPRSPTLREAGRARRFNRLLARLLAPVAGGGHCLSPGSVGRVRSLPHTVLLDLEPGGRPHRQQCHRNRVQHGLVSSLLRASRIPFRNLWWIRLFLWTNPLAFREESYIIPHEIHHSQADQPGDPYGLTSAGWELSGGRVHAEDEP